MSIQSLFLAVVCAGIVSAATAATQCYSCSGINCLRTTRQNITETCSFEVDDCVTIFNKFTVIAKGCLTTMSPELREKCNDRSSSECRICNGKACNDVGRADFKCYECSSKDNANCAKNPSALQPVQCKAPTSLNSYCLTEVTSEGHVRRGCSLHVKEQTECLAKSDCKLCSVENDEGCNNLPKESYVISGGAALSEVLGLVTTCVAVLLLRL